jgi:hypothetical protein
VCGAAAYEWADESGWIPHSATIDVDFPPRWELGEYVACFATKVDDNSPVILDCGEGLAGGQIREMDVKLWASIKPSKDGVPVKCRREQDSISCHLSK